MGLVVPAVLPSSREDLEEKVAVLIQIPGVHRIQIDVVDGHFASPASWPYFVPRELEALARQGDMLPALDRIVYEIDLMCLDAEKAINAWLTLGATRLTFHAESSADLARLLSVSRKRYGDFISFGLAINIASDLALVESHMDDIAYIQFMGIASIGKQGQPFDKRVLEKIHTFHTKHPEVPLQVDGGISVENAPQLIKLDVTNLIVGSSILKAKNPAAAFAAIEALESPFGV